MRKQNKKTAKGKKGGDERRIGVGYVNRDVGHGVPRAMAERCVIRKDVFKKHFDEQATACSRDDWSVFSRLFLLVLRRPSCCGSHWRTMDFIKERNLVDEYLQQTTHFKKYKIKRIKKRQNKKYKLK